MSTRRGTRRRAGGPWTEVDRVSRGTGRLRLVPPAVRDADRGRSDPSSGTHGSCVLRRVGAFWEWQSNDGDPRSDEDRGCDSHTGRPQVVRTPDGGTAAEVLADLPQSRLRSTGGTPIARLAPLTDHDVHDLITAPRCAPLLFGANGARPVDLERLEQLLLRLSRMASELPQLAEADFNPVLATPGGLSVLDARVRLLPRAAQDPYLRRLR
ncbi:acetate--CoA ligase family protein [Streptomyces europaeiscabiei]|nr:acetate--CoA ligase family protein [Streptomyces europaeiscabiei]